MEMMFGLVFLFYAMLVGVFVLWLWALIDIITSKFQENLMQIIWLLVVFFLPFIGVILYLLIGRSMQISKEVSENNVNFMYDQLSKIKELLDNGAITQEEFDAEKNKILNRAE
ncbi:MAG: SHOCT domain-containing protein [Sulfuricurvum sp.]|nr:SHOCT domain-containing protein [Sulfuricurvum sp.]MDP3022785.1 SHOCT domain-containing protein [Sulfuricurvum sp.]